jgi:hypothetical protein
LVFFLISMQGKPTKPRRSALTTQGSSQEKSEQASSTVSETSSGTENVPDPKADSSVLFLGRIPHGYGEGSAENDQTEC